MKSGERYRCKWNIRANAGTFYFLQGREEVQKWRWMDDRLSNLLPDGMVISQLRVGVFSDSPAPPTPSSLRLWLPVFPPSLADTLEKEISDRV